MSHVSTCSDITFDVAPTSNKQTNKQYSNCLPVCSRTVEVGGAVGLPLRAPGDPDEVATTGGAGRGGVRDRGGGQRAAPRTYPPRDGRLAAHAPAHGQQVGALAQPAA